MPKIKDSEIKKVATTKRDFETILKKVSRKIEKSKPSPKHSKT